MNIGKKIKELRKQRGITQEQLAESVGVSFQAVSKWENNIALPDITLAPILANYFGVSMDELFDFSLSKIEAEVESIAEEARNYIESDPAVSSIDSYRKQLKTHISKWKKDAEESPYSYADNYGNLGIKNFDITRFS